MKRLTGRVRPVLVPLEGRLLNSVLTPVAVVFTDLSPRTAVTGMTTVGGMHRTAAGVSDRQVVRAERAQGDDAPESPPSAGKGVVPDGTRTAVDSGGMVGHVGTMDGTTLMPIPGMSEAGGGPAGMVAPNHVTGLHPTPPSGHASSGHDPTATHTRRGCTGSRGTYLGEPSRRDWRSPRDPRARVGRPVSRAGRDASFRHRR